MASLISIIGLCAVLFLAVSAQQNGGKPSKKAKLVIQPEDAHFPFRGNLTIMCQSDVPLTDCQFKLNHWKLDFPVIELAQGQQSTSFEGMDDEGRLRYKAQYYGTGLKNGQCGVVLTDAFWGRYVVSCRARAAEGGWEQATMTYRAGNPATFPMTLQPQRAVVMPGSDVPVLCSAQQALDVCQVTLPTSEDYIDLNLGAESEASDKHQYYGTGLANGQCGVTMLKVTEEDNGPVWCWGELDGKRGTAKAALITVANAPVAPKLELTTGTTYNEGSSLSAVCTVGGSRPVSTITWLLGSKIIRQDAIDDIPVQEWSWPWDKQTITQRVTLKLTKQDNGKDVTCRATHVALKEPMQTKMKIVVNGQTGAKPAGVRPIASKPVNGGKPAGSSGEPTGSTKISIEPMNAHIPFRGNLTVMCQSSAPLAECQFKLNHWKLDFPVIQLAQGQQSPSFEGMDDEGRLRYNARYYGTGLKNGQCGVVLTDAFWGRYVVSCRARAAEGGWEQATMTYRAGNPATFAMSLEPSHATVAPGEDVSVLCSAQQDLDVCQVTVPTSEDYVDFSRGAESEATVKYRYHGTGLARGQCGVTLLKVTEEDNGPVWCWGEKGGARGTAQAALVTVTQPPNDPELTFTSGSSYAEGDTLTAVCTVRGSRPVATLTWSLGSKIIRQDAVDDVPVQEWSWPWDKQTITQRLTLKLTKEDVGKEVVCSAAHVSLANPKESKKTITAKGAGTRPQVATRPGVHGSGQPGQDKPTKIRDLVIEPAHVQIAYRGNVNILCKSAVPLTHCHFRLFHFNGSLPLLDLSQGHGSTSTVPDGRLRYKAEYHGTSLKDGQCGVALNKVIWGRYVASCRTRSEQGVWQQAAMTFSVANKATFVMNVKPETAVVLPGKDHSVVCESDAPLVQCYVDIPSYREKEIFLNQDDPIYPTSHYRYYGKGLQQGQCGVTLAKVTEADNGPVWCSGEQAGQRGSARASLLTVAEPPNSPELTIISSGPYFAGSMLTAQCAVGGSRPVSSITWLLGDKIVRQDSVDDEPAEEWTWPWDKQTIKQTLSIKLTQQDLGKDVVCRATHPAMAGAKDTKMKMSNNKVKQPAQASSRPGVNLVIQPEDAHFPFRGNLTIMCQSDVPLTDCQFKLNHWKLDFPVIELAHGQRSPSFEGMDDEGRLRYTARYYGTGLKNGQCGVVLTDAFWGRYVVSCRARAAKGGWEQATMTYRSGNPATFPMTLQPQRAVVMPGSDVPVLCSAQQALDVCQVALPTSEDYIDLNLGAESEATVKYRYHGTGLARGQCGVKLLKVTEEDNGPVWCWGEKGGARGTARAALITVAEPPTEPELSLTSGTSYTDGSKLTAVCIVRGSRPVSSIMWLLGDKTIRQDAVDDVPMQEWSWPWDKQTVTQRVTVKVTKKDNGKDLICRAVHMTLKVAKQTKIRIAVRG